MKILYFSTVNWKWIKQRPHFIAEGLTGEDIEVEYISLTPFFKQKKEVKRIIGNKLLINDQYVIPYASKISVIEKLNVKYISKLLDKKYDVIIITHPLHYKYLQESLKYNPKIIYECMDNIPYFYEYPYQQKIIKIETTVCGKVDRIITSSGYLKKKIINEYHIDDTKVQVVFNGMDSNFMDFPIDIDGQKNQFNNPNIVYIGTVGKWIELDLINEYAKRNPKENIYFIGPVGISISKNISPNIYFLGKVDHKYVANLINQAEILMIPFQINELIKGVDPVKIYEYKALNKPIISAYWKELERHKKDYNIIFYRGLKEFEQGIKKIRKEKQLYTNKVDMHYIEQNSWDKRVKEYLEIIRTIK